MTQEQNELMFKDLLGRLPYTLKVNVYVIGSSYNEDRDLKPEIAVSLFGNDDISIKPYLRPMSSMADDEQKELEKIIDGIIGYNAKNYFHSEDEYNWNTLYNAYDWLNAHHFDYRGLIDKGLALEAPEGMYKNN